MQMVCSVPFANFALTPNTGWQGGSVIEAVLTSIPHQKTASFLAGRVLYKHPLRGTRRSVLLSNASSREIPLNNQNKVFVTTRERPISVHLG